MPYTKNTVEVLINTNLPNLSERSRTKLTSKKVIKFLNGKKKNLLTYAIHEGDVALITEIIKIDKQQGHKLFDEYNAFEAAIKVGNMEVLENIVRFALDTEDLKRKENILNSIQASLIDKNLLFTDKNKVEATKRVREIYYPNIDQKIFLKLSWRVGYELKGYYGLYNVSGAELLELEAQIFKDLVKVIDTSPIGDILLEQAIDSLHMNTKSLKGFLDAVENNKNHKISNKQLERIVFWALNSKSNESLVFLDKLISHSLGQRLLIEKGLEILNLTKVERLQSDAITYLLEKVNFGPAGVDKDGWNILHYAAYQKDADLFFKILDGQSDASLAKALNNKGESFIDIAIIEKNNAILERLLNDKKYSYFRRIILSKDTKVLAKCIEAKNNDLLEMLLETQEGKKLLASNAKELRYSGTLSLYKKWLAAANIDIINFKQEADKCYSDPNNKLDELRKALANRFLKDNESLDALIKACKQSTSTISRVTKLELRMMNLEQLNYFLRDQEFAISILNAASDELVLKILSTENGARLLAREDAIEMAFSNISNIRGNNARIVQLLDYKEARSYIKNKKSLMENVMVNSSSYGWIKLLDHDEVKDYLSKNTAFAGYRLFRNEKFMNNHEIVHKLLLSGFENQISEYREDAQKGFLGGLGDFGGKEITYFERVLKEKENLRKTLKKELLNILRGGTEEEFSKSTLFELMRSENLDGIRIPKSYDLDLDSSFFQKFRSASSRASKEMVDEIADELLSKKAAYKKIFSNLEARDKKYNRFMNKKNYGSGRLNAVRERFSQAAKTMVTSGVEKGDMNVLLEAWNSACRDFDLPAFTMHLDPNSVMRFDKSKEDILKNITENKEIDKAIGKKLLKNLDEIEKQLASINPTNIERSQLHLARELDKSSQEYTVAEIMFLAFAGVLTVICIALLAVLIAAVVLLVLAASDGRSLGKGEDGKDILDFLGLRFHYVRYNDDQVPVHENFHRLSKSVEQTGNALNDIAKLIDEKGLVDPKLQEDLNKAKLFVSKVREGIKEIVAQYEKGDTSTQLPR